MGGKGQRRREKNYKAAHGGYSRLPPPPKPNEIDALPSKLRKLIEFTSTPATPKGRALIVTENKKNKKSDGNGEKKANTKGGSSSKTNILKEEVNDGKVSKDKHKDEHDESVHEEGSDKKKAKKKRKPVKDLRFGTTDELGSYGSKKREKRDRNKKHLEEKKKKHKKAKIDEGPEFPGREEIIFGDIVDAPPKLLAVPKKDVKKVQSAFHERLRLQAIEAYRNRNEWGSRPGILRPDIIPNLSF